MKSRNFLAVGGMLLSLLACNKDEDKKVLTATIYAEDITFGSAAATTDALVVVTNYYDWTAEAEFEDGDDGSWLSFDPKTSVGAENQHEVTVTFSATSNTTSEPRSAKITFTSNDADNSITKITVTQDGVDADTDPFPTSFDFVEDSNPTTAYAKVNNKDNLSEIAFINGNGTTAGEVKYTLPKGASSVSFYAVNTTTTAATLVVKTTGGQQLATRTIAAQETALAADDDGVYSFSVKAADRDTIAFETLADDFDVILTSSDPTAKIFIFNGKTAEDPTPTDFECSTVGSASKIHLVSDNSNPSLAFKLETGGSINVTVPKNISSVSFSAVGFNADASISISINGNSTPDLTLKKADIAAIDDLRYISLEDEEEDDYIFTLYLTAAQMSTGVTLSIGNATGESLIWNITGAEDPYPTKLAYSLGSNTSTTWAKINGSTDPTAAFLLGDGSTAGKITLTIPAEAKGLSFYAITLGDKSASLQFNPGAITSTVTVDAQEPDEEMTGDASAPYEFEVKAPFVFNFDKTSSDTTIDLIVVGDNAATAKVLVFGCQTL